MKNKLKIIITSLLPALFLVPSVYAFQLFPPMISELLQTWFGGAIPPDYITRILLGLLIFIVFYYAAGFAFNKNAYGESKTNTFRWMVALLVAILTVLFLPQSLMDIYKSMFAMFTPVLVTIGLIVFARKVNKHHTQEGHIGAALAYAIGIALIGFVVAEASQFGIQDFNIFGWSFLDILQLMMTILFVLFFMNIFKAFGGSKTRMKDLGANINEGRKEAEEESEELKKKLKKTEEELEEERRKQRIEINETKEDIRIFKELEVLKSLIGEWAKTISRKVPKGSPAERVKILNEIARIRRDQSIRDRLERVSVKEMKNIDHLVEQTGNYGSNKKKMVRGMEDLIKEEASLNLFFEKLLSYLVYTIETVPNPNPSVPLGVIDKALAVEARIIRIQKQEINYGKIKAREDEGEIKSESPIIQ